VTFLLAAIVLAASLAPASPASSTVDWRDEAIYMVMTDRFRNGDPSNDLDSDPARADWWHGGDLQGVIDELDYIRDLGMTAIWTTPFVEQTKGGYHGYWTLRPTQVDPHLGTAEKLDELVQKAHARGLKVIFDVVLNHLGYDHPWLSLPQAASLFHPQCPINFADQKSVEDCWLAGLPDLNTENPAVLASALETWTYWVRRTGVDGLRIDAARHLPKDYIRQWTSAMKRSFPNLWIFGEIYSSGYRYQSGYLAAGVDAVTDFQTYDSIRIGLDPRGDLSQLALPPVLAADLGTGNENARAIFIDNHDVPRFIGRDAPDAATKGRLAQALVYLYTVPGTPVLYYGTEIALPGGADPDDRRSMPWTGGDEATRLLVRDLATMRHAVPSLRRGSFDELVSERGLLVYDRRGAGPDVAVVAINGDEPRAVDLPLANLGLDGGNLHRTLGTGTSSTIDGTTLHVALMPRAAAVLLIGAAPAPPPGLPLWTLLLFAVAVAAIAAAVIIVRRRSPLRRP
jgi:alpha-amylase